MTAIPPPNAGAPRWRWPWAVEGPARETAPSERSVAANAETNLGAEAGLLDSIPDPVLLLRAGSSREPTDWRFVKANPAARDLLRVQRAEGPLVTVIRDPSVLDAVGQCLFEGRESEADYAAAGVQERTWRALVRPLPPGMDGSRRAALYLRDDTENRRTDRTRADFLANASHELRTPLASLTGFIETLRGHAKDDPAARDKFLGIMQAQAERMSRLVEDLMSLSRIELNEHIPPAGDVDLTLVARDVTDALGPQARDRGVTITIEGPEANEALAVGDRDQLVQVAQNLIDNAIKYSPEGATVKVRILAGLTATEATMPEDNDAARLSLLNPDHAAGERYAALRVTDAGPGLAREHLPRLSERFYRVEGQKSGERSGTGLGLAIVKHIINRHRGGLVVESQIGSGTSFTAYVPMAKPGNGPAV
ncbi:MAG: ATP-binding protein [Caulobacteraceae bacterium]